jgi:hypothetical protein
MSQPAAPVAYLWRADRGARVVRVRLLGAHTDDVWHAPGTDASSAGAQDAARQAAAWIDQRVRASGRREIAALVLDPDGAACSWVTAPQGDADAAAAIVLAAGAASAAGGGSTDGTDAEPVPAAAGRFPDLPDELGVEAITEVFPAKRGQPRASVRVPVLASPDAAARLVLDELDRRGVRVARVLSIWHALTAAWDPSDAAPDDGPGSSRVVAEDAPVTASVLAEPIGGRLSWAWSSAGRLLAAGSARVRATPDPSANGVVAQGPVSHVPTALVQSADVARVAAEWLAWSTQLGLSPGRIVVAAAADESHGLSAQRIASALAARWPGASAVAAPGTDPLGATLRRVQSSEPDGLSARTALTGLSAVPGRAHRRLHLWGAAAGLALAAGLGGLAWRTLARAAEVRSAAAELAGKRDAALQSIDPALIVDPFAVETLRTRVAQARRRLGPSDAALTIPPVLEAFDTLSYLVAAPTIELRDLSCDLATVRATVSVPDSAAYEALRQAMRSLAGPDIDWGEPSLQQAGGRVNVVISGTWPRSAFGPGSPAPVGPTAQANPGGRP